MGVLAAIGIPGWVAAQEAPLSPAAVPPKTVLMVGVAPFERVGTPETSLPEVEELLAERLDAAPGLEAARPEAGAWPADTPSLEAAADAWGDAARLGALVTGRVTQLGGRVSVDARLRAYPAGTSLGTFVEEAELEAGVGPAVVRLADRLAARLDAEEGSRSGLPSVASAPGDSADAEAKGLDADAPIEIRSDELEVIQEGGARRIHFQGSVRAAQEGVTLAADRLEAFYPDGARQPERLDASGSVRVEEVALDRRMRCDTATYFRSEQRVVCRGHAEMEQEGDRVSGDVIEIELDTGRVRVRGGARVNVKGGASGGGA